MKVFALAALLVFAGACRKEAPATAETATVPLVDTDTASATSTASPGGTALVPDVSAGTTVIVVLNDNSIAVRGETIPPGPAVLTIQNASKNVHNLFIEGEGISRAAGDNIDAGATATTDVIFKPGTYTLYCPILDHRAKGEQTTITIAAPAT